MEKLPAEITPEKYQKICNEWERMSRFGFIPFVLLVGFAGFLFLSLVSFLNTWPTLRAHHLSYVWSSEMNWENILLRAIILAGCFVIASTVWFSRKRFVARYQDRSDGSLT